MNTSILSIFKLLKWLNKIWGLFFFVKCKSSWIIPIDHQCTKLFGDVSNSITVTRFITQKTIEWLKPKLDPIVSQQRRGLNSTPECRTCDWAFHVTLLVLTQCSTKMPLQGKIHSLPVSHCDTDILSIQGCFHLILTHFSVEYLLAQLATLFE